MEKTKKMTKKVVFEKSIEIIEASNIEKTIKGELIAALNHEIELVTKKNSSSTPTKAQVENMAIKELIVKALTEIAKPVTITELQAQCPELANYSNQKLTALFTQLHKDKTIVRTSDKKKAYFSIEN